MTCARQGIRTIGVLICVSTDCINSWILSIRVLLFDALSVVIASTRPTRLCSWNRYILPRFAPECAPCRGSNPRRISQYFHSWSMKYPVMAINACWKGDVQQSSVIESFASFRRASRTFFCSCCTIVCSQCYVVIGESKVGLTGDNWAHLIKFTRPGCVRMWKGRFEFAMNSSWLQYQLSLSKASFTQGACWAYIEYIISRV